MISIKNVTKTYGNLTALDNLSLDVSENEVFGLLGPNGAGKTTLIHILATLIKPSSGYAVVNGHNILEDPCKVRSSIGVVFQAPSSDDILTGYENIKVHALLYGIPKEGREKRISEVLDLVGLTSRKDDQVKKYSGGMRRRLEIARGLVHKPRVLFLDEPTLGLDPSSRENMWQYIRKLVQEENVTIILTTHYMEEADKLCDRICFINSGRITDVDSPAKLKETLSGDIVSIKFEDKVSQSTVLSKIEGLTLLDFVHKVSYTDNCLVITVNNANKNIPKILRFLDNVNWIEYKKPTLNDLFLRVSGKPVVNDDNAEGGFMERYARYDKS
ncbi:MAG TPA: ATP-binding cassette domain-containing protein [Nitrososphaeraceae archaeon]|nr:ATP-binding cassette domain-containing protein [Nitrososphaeraceae archaeon]